MPEYAQRWIAAGLATGPAERHRFEEAARQCYGYAGIPWHNNVIWMSSPLTLTLAVLLTQFQNRPNYSAMLQFGVRRCLGEALWDEIEQALLQGRSACAHEPRHNLFAGRRPARAEAAAVSRAILTSVRDAPAHAAASIWPFGSVHSQVHRALSAGVNEVVQSALSGIAAAIDSAVESAISPLYPEASAAFLVANAQQILTHARCILRGSLDPFVPETATRLPLPHCAYSSFLREVCGLELEDGLWDKAHAYEQTMRAAGWWYPQLNALFVCERPEALHYERGPWGGLQLHHPSGPAASWPGGWSIYAVHGCQVPAQIIEHPQAITVADIEHAHNAEVRRVMLERYGYERYIKDCGAEIVDCVPMDYPVRGLRGARLLRKALRDDEALVYLDMINSTPEAGGSYKHYLERINPRAYGGDAGRLCHAAMASRWFYRDEHGELQPTFTRWQDYRPDAES